MHFIKDQSEQYYGPQYVCFLTIFFCVLQLFLRLVCRYRDPELSYKWLRIVLKTRVRIMRLFYRHDFKAERLYLRENPQDCWKFHGCFFF